jgi:ferredoxin
VSGDPRTERPIEPAAIEPADECERVVHGLRIQIDRALCVGFGDCIEEAADAFRLDGEDVVVFLAPERVDRERLLRACDACPVDALTVWDAEGTRLVP